MNVTSAEEILEPLRRRQSQSGNSILWSPETDSSRTLRESSERDCCESRVRSVMIFMAWDLSLGPAWRPDTPRVIRSENERFEYFGKRASCIFYSYLCSRGRPRDARCGGKKSARRFLILDGIHPQISMIPLREVKG